MKELSSQKPFLDLQAALGRIEAVQAENRELKKGLEDIMDTIQSLLGRRKASGEVVFLFLCLSNWRF